MIKLWSAGEVDLDIEQKYRDARKWTESVVNKMLRAKDYGDGLDEWAFIYMINAPSDNGRKEISKLTRNKRNVEFRLRVDHAEFARGNDVDQKRMLLKALARGVGQMRSLGVNGVDVYMLLKDIENLITILDSG